jgi:hypothetical protein
LGRSSTREQEQTLESVAAEHGNAARLVLERTHAIRDERASRRPAGLGNGVEDGADHLIHASSRDDAACVKILQQAFMREERAAAVEHVEQPERVLWAERSRSTSIQMQATCFLVQRCTLSGSFDSAAGAA